MAQIEIDGHIVVFDDDCLETVLAHRWSIIASRNTFYARSNKLIMHRILMGAATGQMVDHINRNGLDNRRENLRFIGHQGNKVNSLNLKKTSAFIGVSKRTGSRPKPYRVQAKVEGRNKYLGRFCTEIEAALAYDEHARSRHGDLAILNFPTTRE